MPEVSAHDGEEVGEHLKEAVEGTLRLKRLLSEDSQDGGDAKKRKGGDADTFRCGPEETKKVKQLLGKWSCGDDVVVRHVLEGCELAELEMLVTANWSPNNWMISQKSAADQLAVHLINSREKDGLGGGTVDRLSAFRKKWNIDQAKDAILRPLHHKALRYIIDNYDGTKALDEVIEEAKEAEPEEGVTEGCMPDAPGMQALGRFNRLEIIDATADAAVFGDANLGFALNLARHRKALGHVGRVIATTFESLEVLRERYKEIDETIATLEEHHAEVYHEVDCTRIAFNPQFKGLEGKIGAVYYNFPHAGAVGGFFDGHPCVNWRHENLMRLFFRALRTYVKPGGLVKVASNMGAVGVRYSYITGGARENEFEHIETVPFMQWNLHRYGRSYGDRRDAYRRPDQGAGYNVQRAEKDMVYTFTYKPTGKKMPPQGIRLPPTLWTLENCQDGPFANVQGQASKNLAQSLYERFVMECSGQHVG
mmetsp:Transcript_83059/g.146731  ORF Transcript_83059/g.146731 Transcript_83059/m.146731 type:complete len:480 (-) Transcript_83059:113-1552(-)|eukprot:CAMPEP_0197642976 /NCGR_PEP_ID=MMETSP1338-20131121/16461_1 /TAXON_ID=43686 ORGANISM="Pelagodinium beii, Strain RCC1491" /NCGR_SAMPLE_ID=MMETSP1338 /ASSEMBLY_ACC=CAM_ASM_000754 /LENGTH=479 /DNA_ID=CAMNT_0043216175 /DNA_START=64 /DNA_END=1503 /DNA_ORIENTATION=+